MTLSNPSCVVIPVAPDPLQIRIPGGITIEGIPPLSGGVITPLGSIQSLLTGLMPAMAGLQPVFLIIDAMIKMMEVFKAIPGLITGDVVSFLDALNEAVTAVVALAQLQPALALPLLLADLIAAMIVALQALESEVEKLQAMSARADAVILQAQTDGDAALEAVGDCIKAQADAYGTHVIVSLGPMGQMMDIAGQLAGLMPAPPELPSIGDATGLSLDELADFLDTLIEVFEAVSIPGA